MCTVPQCAPALRAVPLNVTGRGGSGVVGAKNRQRRRRDDSAAYHHAAASKTSLTDPPWLRPWVIVLPLASVRCLKTTLEQSLTGKGTNMSNKAAIVVGAVVGALVLVGLISFIFSSVFS